MAGASLCDPIIISRAIAEVTISSAVHMQRCPVGPHARSMVRQPPTESYREGSNQDASMHYLCALVGTFDAGKPAGPGTSGRDSLPIEWTAEGLVALDDHNARVQRPCVTGQND